MKVPLIHLIALLCGYFAYRDSGAHTTAFSDNNKVTSVDASVLTLSFGNTKDAQGNDTPAGFDLSANQIDLMVAFDEVDNTADDASNASLDFAHQFALVTIKGASLEPYINISIDEIKIFGNRRSTVGNITFTHDGGGLESTYELKDKTTKEAPYKTASKPADKEAYPEFNWQELSWEEYDWSLAKTPLASAEPLYDTLVRASRLS